MIDDIRVRFDFGRGELRICQSLDGNLAWIAVEPVHQCDQTCHRGRWTIRRMTMVVSSRGKLTVIRQGSDHFSAGSARQPL